MDWQGGITLGIAGAGLGLSLYNTYVAQRDKQPLVTAELALGVVGIGPAAAIRLLLYVVNRGSVDVAITSAGLLLPDGRKAHFPAMQGNATLANTLRARDKFTFWLLPDAVAQTLIESGFSGTITLRAFAVDAVSKEYRGTPFQFDIARFADSSHRV